VFDWLRLPLRFDRRLTRLETRMTTVDEVVQQLNDATDEIARDLEGLRGQITDGDAAAAEKLTPIISRLQVLGQDPQNPVPDVDALPDEGMDRPEGPTAVPV
jgi:hypothetical protein